MSKNNFKKEQERFLDGIGVPSKGKIIADQFQLDAISSVSQGKDVLVVAPTGSGKTFIAIESIREVVKSGKRAVYTTPLKALSNSKYSEFKKIFEPEFTVGLLTGDRKIDGDANIVIATTEIYRNELYSHIGSYQLVVLDEFHYLSDPQRGPVWEESIILSPKSSSLLMLSASISNFEEVSQWISGIRSKEVVVIRETKRPVELRMGFLHPDYGVIPLESREGQLGDIVKKYYIDLKEKRFAKRGGIKYKGERNSRRKDDRRRRR